MIELKNEQLTIKVAEMGAELQSVKDNEGREYMWQAGEKWPRHSPILFLFKQSFLKKMYLYNNYTTYLCLRKSSSSL